MPKFVLTRFVFRAEQGKVLEFLSQNCAGQYKSIWSMSPAASLEAALHLSAEYSIWDSRSDIL